MAYLLWTETDNQPCGSGVVGTAEVKCQDQVPVPQAIDHSGNDTLLVTNEPYEF